MALFTVIRTFVVAIIFNMILPSGDVYSDIAMMYQTWTFRNTESLALFGCIACYGKKVEDLVPLKKDCTLCITKNEFFHCGGFRWMKKLFTVENANECKDLTSVLSATGLGYSESDKCDEKSTCCFETKHGFSIINNNIENKAVSTYLDHKLLVDCNNSWVYDLAKPDLYDACLLAGSATLTKCVIDVMIPNKNDIKKFLNEKKDVFASNNFTGIAYKLLVKENDSISGSSEFIPVKVNSVNEKDIFECGILIKPTNVNILGDTEDVDCGLNICKLHLDYLHRSMDGIHDLKSWQTKAGYYNLMKVGGKNCHLIRVYACSMLIPITISFIFSSMIFFGDVKSGVSRKYEMPILFLLFYPQWRTFKILIEYFKHKKEEELTNQLEENTKNVSYIEPFCESGLQVCSL